MRRSPKISSVPRANSIDPKMNIRIDLDSLRGEDRIAELCRREGISQDIYYKWSKGFIEVGKRRLCI